MTDLGLMGFGMLLIVALLVAKRMAASGMFAALACGDGLEPDAAIRWVRQHYDHRAVETPWQRRWVERWG